MARKKDDAEFICEYKIKDHKIITMEEEKRERVIAAAFREFNKGYHLANLDEIAKKAGISKGLIFHYFGSKRGLFLFLIKYSLDIIIMEYRKVILESSDFLENIRIVSKQKLEMFFRYPLMFGFLVKTYSDSAVKDVFPEGLPGDLPQSSPFIAVQLVRQRSNHDNMLFKDDIDSEKAQNIIMWTMHGYIDSLFRYGDDVDAYKAHSEEMLKELDEYLQILRKILYR
ncbi:TetR/AcrR family transcriptional regulator [Clostridium sp. BJN0013]|uniref:TetR/AcrR family transcriptional regulator n=1 Tax=Clostridium sp. BJN0013 TaxID=3236840 RepID=UPI0034C62F96